MDRKAKFQEAIDALNANPPAFPESTEMGGSYGGMSLRDWFAGQVVPSAFAHAIQLTTSLGGKSPVEWSADVSYRIADAMLTRREKGGDK